MGDAPARPRRNAIDLFALCNGVLLLVLASTSYWQRFLQFRTRANLPEFVAYATFLFAAIAVAWWFLRRLPVRWPVLLLLEASILLHFAAGLVRPGGVRLYDVRIGLTLLDYPLRFDKIVHLVNAFVGCAVTLELFRLLDVRVPRIRMLVVSLVVLGGGAIIEIVEWFVLKIIPHNGVGDYDNNLTDLLANLVGCGVFVLLSAVRARFSEARRVRR